MFSLRSTIPLTMLLLSGCVVGPNPSTPEMQLPNKFAEGSKVSNGNIAQSAWWTAFNDSRLNSYVATGLSQNLDIQQAIERINQADAAVIIETAGSLPSLVVSGNHNTSGSNGSLSSSNNIANSTRGNANVSWLLDLFGQYARSRESAEANLGVAYSTVDIQRLAFINAVSSAYVDVRYYQERLEIARQNLKSRRDTLNLTQLQLDAGAASRLDVVQSEGLVNSTLAEMPGLETQFRGAAHRIATLLGLPASSLIAELQKGSRQPVARRIPATGVPADLIRNRPDIRAAELKLAAAVSRIGVAEAALYPSITLSGSITPTYTHVNGSGGGSNTTWGFGPSLNLPIFDGGRLKANVTDAESKAREAYLAWKATVLKSIEEVENSLAAINRGQRTADALRKTLNSSQEALNLSTASYRDGASSLLDILDAQRQVSSSQASLAQAVRQTALDFISLNTALGGGYAVGDTRVASAATAKTQ